MSGRALRAGWVVGGALVLLSGCSLGTHSGTGSGTASPVAASAPPPVGSIEHPRPLLCVDSIVGGTTAPARSPSAPAKSPTSTPTRTPTTSTASPNSGRTPPTDDVTVGPLTWPGLAALADGDQRARGKQDSGGWHYRVDALLRPGTTATVTVGADQRARAGLEFGDGYGIAPAPAVAFHACQSSTSTFRGSFFVAGDGRACVPLDIRVGDSPARHVVISFFSGHCPA